MISHILLASHMHFLPIFNISHHSGIFVPMAEHSLTRHYHPRSMVYRIHSGFCTFSVAGQLGSLVKEHSLPRW